MAKIHDLFIIELAEVIKGYGNDPDVEDPFRLSEFYRFYELPNIAVSRENFEKMRPAYQEQRWVPCSERLPEEIPYYYLVTVANHGTFFTTTFPDEVAVVKWDYDRRKGRGSFHWCDERTVTAWRPLPEPYKEAET